ncbi:MAG: CHAD domain-containing protein [Rhodobacteraceae bacterium]|nr:CHAD domain-containing protein [Paracoccaceae bacterium]
MSDPDLTREMAAAEALRRVAGRALAAFETARGEVMATDAPSGPHRARVALRRLRSHLRAFRPVTAEGALAPLEEEARALFRLLGPLRDADVLVHDIGAADARALAGLEARAAEARGEARAALAAAGAERFAATATATLAGAGWEGRKAGRPARKAAARALARARRRLLAHGRRLAAMAEEDRHAARKDLKALRYLVDDWGGLWPRRKVAPLARRLRALQDGLGALNDLALAEARGAIQADRVRELRETAMVAAGAAWRTLRRARVFW